MTSKQDLRVCSFEIQQKRHFIAEFSN